MTNPVWSRAEPDTRHPAVWIAPEATLREVARALWVGEVGAALVGDGHRIQGVISERDLVGALAHGGAPDEITAEAVMTADVVSIRPGDSVYDAAVDMLECGIRHVPLVDGRGEVSGVVSVRDLLRPLLVHNLEG